MTSIFAHPWGLAALAGVPAVLALHLFWRRFRPRRIAGLFLWAPESRQILAGRTRDRLYRTASLLCELLAATALGLAAAGLSPPIEVRGAHLVLVLDGSASMSARAEDGSTFAERAAARARKELEGLGPADAATVLVSGPASHVAAGPRGDVRSALAALEDYLRPLGPPGTPFSEAHALDAAMSLAAELAAGPAVEPAVGPGGGDGRVLVLTDTPRPPDAVPPTVEFVALGEPRPNVAIVAAARSVVRPGRGGAERAFVAVRNLGRSTVRCELVFERAGGEIARSALELQPGVTAPASLALVPSPGDMEDDAVDVRLEVPEGANALPLDDRATLLPPRFPEVVVDNRLVGPARRQVERALACMQGVRLARAGKRTAGAASEDAETPLLVFCEGADEPVSPRAWRVVFEGAGEDEAKRLAGPYVLARRHPIMEDVSLAGVIWAVSEKPSGSAGGPAVDGDSLPFISCGSRILAFERTERTERIARPDPGSGPGTGDEAGAPSTAGTTFVFRLDLARSNISRTPAWPVLLGNIVEERRKALPGVERRNVALGEMVRVRLADEAGGLTVARGRERRPLPGAGLRRAVAARTLGTHEIRDEDGTLDRFHVNFLSPGESDLRLLGSAELAPRMGASRAGASADGRSSFTARAAWPGALLAAVALLACIADWVVLARSQRVRPGRAHDAVRVDRQGGRKG